MTDQAPISFVARDQGRWWLTPVPRQDPVEVQFDELLDLVGPTTATPRPDATPLAPDAVVGPVWTFVGRPGPGGLVVRTTDHDLVLDRHDLRLVDLLTGPTRVADVVAHPDAGSVGDVPGRLAHLVAIGAATLVATPAIDEPATESAPEPAPATEPRARPKPAGWLSRLAAKRHPRDGGGPTPDPLQQPEAAQPAAEPPAEAEPSALIGPSGGPVPAGPPGRIPVYAIWHPETGPLLALGMLTAAARHLRDGALNEVYEIRRPETAASFLADQAERPGPAVLLCSDYVWTLEANLEAARAGLALNPDLVVIHGGPSSPKFPGDAERFIAEHGEVAHVLTRGEGEHMVCELLAAVGPTLPELDPEVLASIDGITFRDPRSGAVVRTEDRSRITDLDSLPSPYLTGEFDHIPIDGWRFCLSVETNRGCPYSCSYCDWGSSTLSRIRKFSLERVHAEIEWAADRGAQSINLPDANFGIMSRDVETASRIAETRRTKGFPLLLSFYPAKNTTKHLVRIMDVLVEGGVGTTASISLQTTDEETLKAIDRDNISTAHYVALAASYRRRGFPIQGDLLIGLPGQTYDSYRRDLQFNFDHEIQARTWQLKILPNAPMNDPEYRERFQIRSDDQHRVRSTSTFTEADRIRMQRLRDLDIVAERLGVFRHVLRWMQWDHGLQESVVLDRILDITYDDPLRYPHLTWITCYFERHATAPAGWDAVYRELRDLMVRELGVDPSSAMDAVLHLNRFLMPEPGRTFPATTDLEHDYVSYHRDATRSLYVDGHATGPERPLHSYGPASFTVESDPLGLCSEGLRFPRHGEGDEMESDFSIGANSAHELLSPLVRLVPHLLTAGITVHDLSPDAPSAQGLLLADEPEPAAGTRVAVSLSPSP